MPPTSLPEAPTLGTVPRILVGYLLSCLAGGFVANAGVTAVMFINPPPYIHAYPVLHVLIVRLLLMFAQVSVVVFILTFLPAAIFISVTEWVGERRFTVHVAAGAGMSILGLWLLVGIPHRFDTAGNNVILAALVLGGAAAGAAYWKVSGRYAGSWRGKAE